MKEITVLSGKGGSGKTSISSSFVSLSRESVICDCDVEAPNLHILLQPQIITEEPFYGMQRAYIDPNTCIKCDICTESCHYGAIHEYRVNQIQCEGCRFCTHLCPVEAISMIDHTCGRMYHSHTSCGEMFHAMLQPGEQNSGKLVAQLREKARTFAQKEGAEIIITDGPPGTGCPTISSLTGTDLAVLTTEPTLSAMHDMLRLEELCQHFQIKYGVIINKASLNESITAEIVDYCQKHNLPVFGQIDFDKRFRQAINTCTIPVDYSSDIKNTIQLIWNKVLKVL